MWTFLWTCLLLGVFVYLFGWLGWLVGEFRSRRRTGRARRDIVLRTVAVTVLLLGLTAYLYDLLEVGKLLRRARD